MGGNRSGYTFKKHDIVETKIYVCRYLFKVVWATPYKALAVEWEKQHSANNYEEIILNEQRRTKNLIKLKKDREREERIKNRIKVPITHFIQFGGKNEEK